MFRLRAVSYPTWSNIASQKSISPQPVPPNKSKPVRSPSSKIVSQPDQSHNATMPQGYSLSLALGPCGQRGLPLLWADLFVRRGPRQVKWLEKSDLGSCTAGLTFGEVPTRNVQCELDWLGTAKQKGSQVEHTSKRLLDTSCVPQKEEFLEDPVRSQILVWPNQASCTSSHFWRLGWKHHH